MTANTQLRLSKEAQATFLLYEQYCVGIQNATLNLRNTLLTRDKLYSRIIDNTKTQVKNKAANAYGDPTKYQNVIVPIIEPQVENAVVYQASVFLTGNPIFGVVADPANEDAALQMQSLIEENSIRGGWVNQFMMVFRDLFKYNLAAVEVVWDRINTPAFDTDITYKAGQEGKPKNIVWEGNCINRMDLYNTFFDARVPPKDIPSKGEFAGYVRSVSRVELRCYMDAMMDLIKENYTAALASNLGGAGTNIMYYQPVFNPSATIQEPAVGTGTNWLNWARIPYNSKRSEDYSGIDAFDLTVMYVRIVPREFAMPYAPAAGTPQVWKLTIVNHQVIIGATRLTNAHNLIPILFAQAKDDGLRYQTKSLLDNAEPFQAVATALMNSMIASRRRAISDRGLYDPSRVASEHINSDNPAAKIPVRPKAYGKPLSESYYPIPFRDEQAGVAMQEIQAVSSFSESLNGQNRSRQGQFTKGNRTLQEYEDVMAHSNGRDQMTSMSLEAQLFTPVKEILKINTIQYQGPATLYSNALGREVKVDPLVLRKTLLSFKMSDGLLPTAKIINGDDFGMAMQAIGTNPQIGGAYNLAPMFSYLMKTRNVNLTPFEKSQEQQAYEQALGAWQQMATLAIEKDKPFNIPQPTPQQFGYVPGQAAGQDMQQQVSPQSSTLQ